MQSVEDAFGLVIIISLVILIRAYYKESVFAKMDSAVKSTKDIINGQEENI